MKSLGFWKLLVSILICLLASMSVRSNANKEGGEKGGGGEAAKLKDISKILEVCPTRNKERLLILM